MAKRRAMTAEERRQQELERIRRRIQRKLNRVDTRHFRSECRGCRYFHGGWDAPVFCMAPRGESATWVRYLVAFTERPCAQREQRPMPELSEFEVES